MSAFHFVVAVAAIIVIVRFPVMAIVIAFAMFCVMY